LKTPVGNPNLERSAGLEFEKPQVWRKTRQALRYKNRRSWRIDAFWFLELEQALALFRKIEIFAARTRASLIGTPFPLVTRAARRDECESSQLTEDRARIVFTEG